MGAIMSSNVASRRINRQVVVVDLIRNYESDETTFSLVSRIAALINRSWQVEIMHVLLSFAAGFGFSAVGGGVKARLLTLGSFAPLDSKDWLAAILVGKQAAVCCAACCDKRVDC
ncbi:hypothetical protein V6N11_000087 [Hibiscus sabdariffa]|uniref:Uncharacterized protein n=1 Tax=Hibiscus sabdariffa TaxID=183260 RepID=A0ABR2NP54_9ROSI